MTLTGNSRISPCLALSTQFCILQANLWMAYATTGAAKKRDISKGGIQLTDEEKIEDALQVASNHMTNYYNSCMGIPL